MISIDPYNTMFNIGDNIVTNLMRGKTTFYNWLVKAAEKTKYAKPKILPKTPSGWTRKTLS